MRVLRRPKTARNILWGCLLSLLATGCSNLAGNPATRIIGQWQSEVAGVPVVLVYSDATVQVGDAAPVPYQLEGDELRFPGAGQQVRIVSFPSRNRMVLEDPLTGTRHEYARIPGA